MGFHLVFHHQSQRQDERTGDGQFRVQQVAVVVGHVPQEGDFRVTGQMEIQDAGRAVPAVLTQAQRQVISPDFQIKNCPPHTDNSDQNTGPADVFSGTGSPGYG